MYKSLSRSVLVSLLPVTILVAVGPATRPSSQGKLDASGGFFLPPFLADGAGDPVVAEGGSFAIKSSDYLRYLAARAGKSFVADCVFAVLVAKECRARKLAASAPALAKALARRQLREAGQRDDPETRARIANEILLRQRVDALVRNERKVTDAAVAALFDDRYGVDGQRVRVRQILVSLPATEQRLKASGNATPSSAEIERAAMARAKALHARIDGAASFVKLLGESDDPTTKSLLEHPRFRGQAGFLEGYNYQRYGVPFATAVRRLAVGAISAPVQTSHGVHLIHLVERKTTGLAGVRDELVKHLKSRPASAKEELDLRRTLFEKYEVKLGD